MASFGKRSKEERNTLHPKLQRIVDEAIKHEDFSIIQGIRYIEEQEELLRAGKTKTLKSKHLPDKNGKSRAMDIVPYPIDWSNRERFILFAGKILGIAHSMGIGLIWGGDWNDDGNVKDTSFFDAPHFQLKDEE